VTAMRFMDWNSRSAPKALGLVEDRSDDAANHSPQRGSCKRCRQRPRLKPIRCLPTPTQNHRPLRCPAA
jgi:hypothetical protein